MFFYILCLAKIVLFVKADYCYLLFCTVMKVSLVCALLHIKQIVWHSSLLVLLKINNKNKKIIKTAP